MHQNFFLLLLHEEGKPSPICYFKISSSFHKKETNSDKIIIESGFVGILAGRGIKASKALSLAMHAHDPIPKILLISSISSHFKLK